MKLSLDIISDTNETLFSAQGTGFLQFDMLNTPFRLGDRFVITSSDKITELEILLDTSLGVSRVLLTDGHLEFPIPFDKRRRAYPPAAFGGNRLWGYIRALVPRERRNYRNLSLNTYDLPGQTSVFPHASTNSGTADERFMARNAIDGVTQTRLHGEWPYASWGINGRSDAWIQIDFGCMVEADELRVFSRADFPHDSWWDKAEAIASDGRSRTLALEKTGAPQTFGLGGGPLSWIRIQNLHQGEPGKFPALSQVQVWGRSL